MSSFDPSAAAAAPAGSSGFTIGRKSITLKRRQGNAGGSAGSADEAEQQLQQEPQQRQGGGGGGGRKGRVRINLKDRKPVALSLRSAGGSAEEAKASLVDEGARGEEASLLSLADATGQRRRLVEVRQRSAREAQLNARRIEASQSAVSGFNTAGGSRKALITLPKDAERMAARERLMQIHPHIAQLFRGRDPPATFPQQEFSRVLEADAPTLPYRRRKDEIKSVVQWGERKLFLYELEFLTQYGVRPNTVVVYANCAPGTRFSFLLELFPQLQFVLVDPTPLDLDESRYSNVVVRQEAFTDEVARELAASAQQQQRTLLFVAHATSDTGIGYVAGDSSSSGGGGGVTGGAEQYAEASAFSLSAMDDQARWHGLLQPAKSLLKFSLPWTSGSTYYLDGDIILPVWNAPTSTETRLVPNTFHRTWNHQHYEEQLFHFQTMTRCGLHEHGVTAEGLDGCYDCTAEVYILERYLERYPHLAAVAVGSQADVIPSPAAPATQLKLDTTRFRDPIWVEKQKARKAQFLVTLVDDNAGQPLNEAQMADAERQFEMQEQEQEQMEAEATPAAASSSSSSADAAAAAAAAGDAPMDAAVPAAAESADAAAPTATAVEGEASMSDAAPLTPLQELKLTVGKFSQEVSRRLTHGGTRTLATLNAKVIQKVAFSRKNRA